MWTTLILGLNYIEFQLVNDFCAPNCAPLFNKKRILKVYLIILKFSKDCPSKSIHLISTFSNVSL